MPQLRFENQFPEPLRCWIAHAPRRWPAPEGWWLDLAREELRRGGSEVELAAGADLAGVADVGYLPPVDGVANWFRQELRQRLTEAGADPIVQDFPGEEVQAGGGVAVVDLTPALLPVRLRRLESVPEGAHCCWPLVPGLTTDESVIDEGLGLLAAAGAAGVQPVVPSLSASERRKLGELTGRRGYRELFHGSEPDVRSFTRRAAGLGLAWRLERPACGRTGRALANRKVATRLHLLGELILRSGGSLDESLAHYRAGRWADGETLDIEELVRTGNLSLLPQLSPEAAREIELFAAGEPSERFAALEADFGSGGAAEARA